MQPLLLHTKMPRRWAASLGLNQLQAGQEGDDVAAGVRDRIGEQDLGVRIFGGGLERGLPQGAVDRLQRQLSGKVGQVGLVTFLRAENKQLHSKTS